MSSKIDNFAGTTAMIKLAFRRDRIIVPIFVLFMVLIIVGTAATFADLYSDATVRNALYLQMQNNYSYVALLGSILDPSVGGLTAWRIGIGGSIIIGLINIFLIIRHTRSEERKGRLELLYSASVGRQAALTSALITSFGVNLIVTLITALGLIGLGLEATSSMVFALSIGLFGCLISSITAVAVQLTESSGDARYLTIGLLIGFYMLRIVGWDSGSVTWISWLSPFGWVHYTRPFAGNDLWVFGIFLIFITGLTITAYWLSSIRDVGSGIITQRPGPARASKSLKSSLALAWRLHRGMLLFWVLIFVLMGALMGFTAQSVNELISSNPQFLQLITQIANSNPVDSYFTFVFAFLGIVFAVYAILATSKLWSQESQKYSEMLLTNSVSRSKWAVSNLIFAVLGPAVVIILFSLALGLAYGFSSGNISIDLTRIVVASLAYLPAVWILTGITMLLFGLIPRLTSLSWAALGLFLLIDLLGQFFDFDEWILNLSPFTHVPKLLAGDTVNTSLGWLFILAAVLIIVGVMGYRRRDISG